MYAGNPICMHPHMRDNAEIHTMYEEIHTFSSPAGAVEKWLLDVEADIRRTLHKVAGDSLEAYARSERSRWILEWPGQIVLNCSQVRGWGGGYRSYM